MADETQRWTGNSADPADTGLQGENTGRGTRLPEAPPAVPGAVERPKLPVSLALAAILLIAGAIAMSETNRLVTGALTPAGESRGVTDVVGMAAPRGTGAWSDWLLLRDMRRSVAVWIFFHALFDVALYVGYWLLLRKLLAIAHSRARSRGRFPSSAPQRTLWVLLAFEIAETVLLWLGSALLSRGWVPLPYRVTLAGVATAKWVTAAILVIVLLGDEDIRATVRQGVVRVSRAVWEQRLSFLVVTVAGVLALVPLPNIWDQLPDVERSWLDGDLDDARHPFLAMFAVAVVSLYLFIIGRLFSERVWTTWVGNPSHGPQPPRGSPNWWWWTVPPLLALVAAAVLTVLHLDELVDWQNVAWVVVVPLVILALSGLVAGYYRLHKWLRDHHPQQESGEGAGGGGSGGGVVGCGSGWGRTGSSGRRRLSPSPGPRTASARSIPGWPVTCSRCPLSPWPVWG